MKPNSVIVRDFIEKIIAIGTEIASRKYILLVLSNAISEQRVKYAFLDYIKIGENVFVDERLDTFKKEEIIDPFNKIFDYLFLETSKKMLRDRIDESTYNEFKSFGLHI